MTRFELTRVIGARALQISFGAPALVKPKKDMTPIDIAKEELEKKVSPLIVLRTYPSGDTRKLEL